MSPRRTEVIISPQVEDICEKIEADRTGETLTRSEKQLIITREEAARIASVLAGRTITPDYIRQLTRGKNPRLVPERATGNTYLYKVGNVIRVRFTSGHKREEAPWAARVEKSTEPEASVA